MTATATRTAPAEIVRPGRHVQRVNVTDSDGTFVHQVVQHGTEAEVRAYAETLITHQ